MQESEHNIDDILKYFDDNLEIILILFKQGKSDRYIINEDYYFSFDYVGDDPYPYFLITSILEKSYITKNIIDFNNHPITPNVFTAYGNNEPFRIPSTKDEWFNDTLNEYYPKISFESTQILQKIYNKLCEEVQ